MFLKEFSVDKKRMILDLGIYTAKADDILTDDEKAVIDKLCTEMGLSKGYDPVHSLDTTLFTIQRVFSEDDKKKIFIEVVAIVASDVVTEREQQFLRTLQKQLGISDEKYDIALSVAKDFLRVTNAIDTYLQ